MGRITVFAIDSCRHCKRAKGALTSRNIPYTEINLSSYPEKRSDMLALSDKLTVPQIFFNEKHIGGADETVTVLETWDIPTDSYKNPLERFQQEIEAKEDPTDPRLQIPSGPPVKKKNPPPPRSSHQMEDEFQLPNTDNQPQKKSISYAKLYHVLLQVLPRNSKPYLGKYYKNCFTGKEAVDAIQSHYELNSREAAVDFLCKLQQSKMMDHVTHDHVFGDNSFYYRLQSFFNPKVLNSMRVWTDRIDPDANGLVIRLKQLLGKVESAATDDNGYVDYVQAKNDPLFYEFQEASCELQKIDMLQMDAQTRLAFCINLYNVMIIHAFIQLGIPTSNIQRVSFFGKVGYNVGGHILSFNELENGIIRANKRPPYNLSSPFSSSDPRLPLALETTDPRIHFALNCGAKSCPPIKTFSSESIDEELRIVSQSFNESDDNVLVDETNHELTLSMILNWYRSDFASSKSDLPQSVLSFLRGEKKEKLKRMIDSKVPVKVKFFTYDWSTNASKMTPFNAKSLDVTKVALSALLSY